MTLKKDPLLWVISAALSELTGMRVRQADLAQRTIRLEPGTTKNSEGREVVMTDAVFTLLSACVIGKSPNDYVFTRKNGKPVRDFRNTWENACVRAGVGTILCAGCNAPKVAGKRCADCKKKPSKYVGLIFHDLRRTAARNLRRAGIAEGVIMSIGGWKTRSVFERYAIVSRTDIADAMRKLQQAEKALEETAVVTIGHEIGHAAQQTKAPTLPAHSRQLVEASAN
jgi:integrase